MFILILSPHTTTYFSRVSSNTCLYWYCPLIPIFYQLCSTLHMGDRKMLLSGSPQTRVSLTHLTDAERIHVDSTWIRSVSVGCIPRLIYMFVLSAEFCGRVTDVVIGQFINALLTQLCQVSTWIHSVSIGCIPKPIYCWHVTLPLKKHF